ncbi:hypothetical protein PT974_10812 [Cladobotryum mycophilum]|uniref:Uncharacterized protein n=1 Tax=Cladobotryum mycophilum TaxID=491253 RepID=A0ABR0SBH2_9HYPO
MELFATGFNAWHQLSFETPGHEEEEEPHDLHFFTKVLQGVNIGRPVARLSYTIVCRDANFRLAGPSPHSNQDLEFLYTSAETANGEILTICSPSNEQTGNVLVQHSSLASGKPIHDRQSWPCNVPARQIAAFDTGFVILYQDGTVSTLGDPRFESSLGRDITPEQPAHIPGPVPDLNDLDDPVRHVTAGGYSVAALTASGSVYVWGTPSAGTHRRRQAFPSVTGVPNYMEVDGDKDVQDIALGDSHAIALTTDGCVHVIGENNNGQLGLGRDFGERAEQWTKVPFEAGRGFKLVGVAAGPKSSFIITSSVTDS